MVTAHVRVLVQCLCALRTIIDSIIDTHPSLALLLHTAPRFIRKPARAFHHAKKKRTRPDRPPCMHARTCVRMPIQVAKEAAGSGSKGLFELFVNENCEVSFAGLNTILRLCSKSDPGELLADQLSAAHVDISEERLRVRLSSPRLEWAEPHERPEPALAADLSQAAAAHNKMERWTCAQPCPV